MSRSQQSQAKGILPDFPPDTSSVPQRDEVCTTWTLPSREWQSGEVNTKQTDKYNLAMLSAIMEMTGETREKWEQVSSTLTN